MVFSRALSQAETSRTIEFPDMLKLTGAKEFIHRGKYGIYKNNEKIHSIMRSLIYEFSVIILSVSHIAYVISLC